MRHKKMWIAFTSLLILGLLLAGCHQTTPTPTPEEGEVTMIRYQPEGVCERVGMDPAGLDRLAQTFEEMIEQGLHSGAQLAIYREGELVLALAGGIDVGSGKPITHDSLFSIRSTTKALTALVMAMLYDRGLFSYDDPVSKFWPEFAQNGKMEITIGQVASHRAGIPIVAIPLVQLDNREAVAKAIEGLKPIWTPGAANGYHAATYGDVLNELAMRLVGQNIASLLRTEVTEPLGVKDVYLGLPESEYPRYCHMAVLDETLASRAAFSDFLNTYEGIRLPLAWVGAVATARDLAYVFNIFAFEGTFGGRTFLSKETQALISTPTNRPGEVDRYLLLPIRWGLGLILGDSPYIYGTPSHPRAIGHAGGGATVAWADPDEHLAVAFLCNGMRAGGRDWERFRVLGDLIYASLLPTSTPRPTPIPTPIFKQYVNEAYGFSVKYPEEYAEEEVPPPSVFKARVAAGLPSVEVFIKDVEQGTTFADLKQLVEADMIGREGEDIEFVSEKEKTLADGVTPAYEIIVEWYAVGYELKSIYLSVIKGNKWFVVKLNTTRGSWPAFEAEIMQIAYSWQFE